MILKGAGMLFRSVNSDISFLRKPYFFHSEFIVLFISVGLTMSNTPQNIYFLRKKKVNNFSAWQWDSSGENQLWILLVLDWWLQWILRKYSLHLVSVNKTRCFKYLCYSLLNFHLKLYSWGKRKRCYERKVSPPMI